MSARSPMSGNPSLQTQTSSFLLDTHIINYFVRGAHPRLNQLMMVAIAQQRCCVSVITYAQLHYGMANKPLAIESKKRTEQTLARLTILPWQCSAADVYAKLKANLRNQGRAIGELDTQIAAHALAEGLTLVTHNTKHFEGIDELKLEDWTL